MRKLATILILFATLAAVVLFVDFVVKARKAENSLRATGVSDAVSR